MANVYVLLGFAAFGLVLEGSLFFLGFPTVALAIVALVLFAIAMLIASQNPIVVYGVAVLFVIALILTILAYAPASIPNFQIV